MEVLVRRHANNFSVCVHRTYDSKIFCFPLFWRTFFVCIYFLLCDGSTSSASSSTTMTTIATIMLPSCLSFWFKVEAELTIDRYTILYSTGLSFIRILHTRIPYLFISNVCTHLNLMFNIPCEKRGTTTIAVACKLPIRRIYHSGRWKMKENLSRNEKRWM